MNNYKPRGLSCNISYTQIELCLIVLKSSIIKLIQYIVLIILKYVSDTFLFFISNDINYKNQSDILSSDSDDEQQEFSAEYTMVLNKLNINNIISKYTKNKNKNAIYCKKSYYIIKSFLFNFDGTNIINKSICTKKLIIMYNLFNILNTLHINDITTYHKYIYIFYKNDLNEFKVKIIDIRNNIDITTKNELLFNIISL